MEPFVDRRFLNDDGTPNTEDYPDLRHQYAQEWNDEFVRNKVAVGALQDSAGVSQYYNFSGNVFDLQKIGTLDIHGVRITNNLRINLFGSTSIEFTNAIDGIAYFGNIQIINQSAALDDELILNDDNLPFYHAINEVTRLTWEWDGTRYWFDSECDPQVQNTPIVDLQPVNIEQIEGQTFADGFKTQIRNYLSLQWLKDGVSLPNKKGSNLLFQAPATEDIADYTLEITGYDNKKYHTKSAYLLIRPLVAPQITSTSVSTVSIPAGQNVTFYVAYTGYPVPTPQLLVSDSENGTYTQVIGANSSPATVAIYYEKWYKWQVGTGGSAAFTDPVKITPTKVAQATPTGTVVDDTNNYFMIPASATPITAYKGTLDATVGSPVMVNLIAITFNSANYYGLLVGDINLQTGKAGIRLEETLTLGASLFATNATAFTASYQLVSFKDFAADQTFTPFLTYPQGVGTVTLEETGAHLYKPNTSDQGNLYMVNGFFTPGDKIRLTVTMTLISGTPAFTLGDYGVGDPDTWATFNLVDGINITTLNTAGLNSGAISFASASTHDYIITSIKLEKTQ